MRISMRYSENMPDIFITGIFHHVVKDLLAKGYVPTVKWTPGLPKKLRCEPGKFEHGKWQANYWDEQNAKCHRVHMVSPKDSFPINYSSCRMNAAEIVQLGLQPDAKAEAKEKKLAMLNKLAGGTANV